MINNDCKLLINLNQLVRDRPNGQDLDTEHVDQIANDLRRNMNFDSFYEQADVAITDYCDDVGIDLKEQKEGWISEIGNILTGDLQEYKLQYILIKVRPNLMDEEHPHINDLYEDMDRLNALYEELMWPNDVALDFTADYENNRIIISLKDDSK